MTQESSYEGDLFLVEKSDEGGYTARALGASIFTEGDDLDEVRRNVREAVDCHFDAGDKPQIIRLHFVRDEVIPA
jgi:predicted RNase H-like HicB family nuclease